MSVLAGVEIREGGNIISGQAVKAVDGEVFEVHSPATRQLIGSAPFSKDADVDAAVASAKEAQKEWAQLPARVRGQKLLEIARLLREKQEDLAQLMCLETGKAIRTECRLELGIVPETFEFYGGLASEIKGETVPFDPNILTYTRREPVGVVGAIIPWNAPLMLMAFKVCPAVLCGNAVVVKSAEQSPLITQAAVEIINTVLPAGVCNLISGDGPVAGAALARHEDVNLVTFTGSVASGKAVNQSAAARLVPVALELGGKSPMIVCEDADMEAAVEGANVGMRFTRQGQSCSAASRIFVHASLRDAFVEKLKACLDEYVIGDPMDERTDVGSLISQEQYETVCQYIEAGKASGAQVHECSQLPEDKHLKDGFFLRPTLFTEVKNKDTIAQEEIFGPVACIIEFNDFEEALAMANDTTYGLAGTIWTQDIKTALNGVHGLEAGFVQVNQNMVVRPGLSYGGYKNSGLGHEASLESMLEHYTRKKTVLVNLT